jgi:hypothetical protein
VFANVDASADFISVHELSRQIIGKGSYLERGSTTTRVNGVHLDPIKLIIGKDRDELPGLEFGPAHPSRGERYSESRFGAGNDAIG